MPPRLHVRFLAAWALAGGMVAAAWTTATGQTRREPPAKPPEPAPASRPAETPQPLQVVRMSTGPDGAIVARLSNGLTAIVKASRSAPVVCVRCYVKAGSLYEGKWLGAGLSHLVEHLVAKGAVHGHGDGGGQTQSPKETRSRIDRIGGQSNAYTSLATTGYYISASAGKTMECVDLIADWMARPDIAKEDFEREHGVVQRELETGKDNPARRMWTVHGRAFFGDHPAALPVIGFAQPLKALTLQDVAAYHARMYVPQNMVFCVVGDVDVDAVLKRICRAFAGFATARSPRLALGPVGEISSTRRGLCGHKNLKDTMVRISFRTVPLTHDDLYPLDVLSYVLSAGRSSRLFETIQRQQKLVTSISTSSWTPAWGAGMFTVAYRAAPDKAEAAEKAVLAELKAAIDKGVSPLELARAKRQKVADFVYSQQTVESQSGTMCSDYQSTGDAWFSADYTRRIQAVSAAEVRAAAKKYLNFDRMVVTYLVPDSRMKARATQARSAAKSRATCFRLPNGLRVVLKPDDAVGLVSMAFVTRGGLMLETPQTNGLGTLMAALSTRGAGKRTAPEIAAFFDQAGGAIAGKCGNNTFYWQATVLHDALDGALEILADVVERPTYSEEELSRLRPVLLAGIRRIDEEWSSQAQRFWRGKFFAGTPYAMLASGSAAVVEKADVGRITAHHRKTIKAGQSVLAIFGRFDAKAVRKQVERLFGGVPKGEDALAVPPARKVRPGGELHVLPTKNEVAAVTVAAPGMKVTDLDDRLAITVLDTIISGFRLPSGWLHKELRGKQLVYVVHAYNWAGLAPGAFVTYAACQPAKAPEVVAIVRRHLKRAADYKPTPEEVRQAVNTILTAELLETQSMEDLAMAAALDELYGMGYDFRSRLEGLYRRITPQDVLRVGRKYLSGDFVVMVTTPKPEALKAPPTDAKDTAKRKDP